ncbi:hypothetical protein P170DRAFT_24667 [Aspergillus steynii IBT 23096]|uniref:Uncharacterized protein n=1 Tax=Aspergillus steynii IBT 23096 TaxID=1392250 RepID=A0A2I2GPI7_9EURO|nr:uncharacterized protein P170DRAFT_24667 [Aspergillus steynii IBT 23096]PLB54773.1 hypothetical protein P170DRAFT_24667 [Aspergillus steynii IBT 23096]
MGKLTVPPAQKFQNRPASRLTPKVSGAKHEVLYDGHLPRGPGGTNSVRFHGHWTSRGDSPWLVAPKVLLPSLGGEEVLALRCISGMFGLVTMVSASWIGDDRDIALTSHGLPMHVVGDIPCMGDVTSLVGLVR